MLNIVITVLMILIVMAFAAAAVLALNHHYRLREESLKHRPPGRMLTVNDKKMHVYTEGDGDFTLVFMAGHGTSSPTLDFKPLWKRMTDEYRIAVVEKSGYGWSDPSKSPRNVDLMVEENRALLREAGEKAPYVLLPHSISGLEALYWAKKYPEEIKAVIGLDPCTPDATDLISDPDKIQLTIMYFISRIGLSRFIPKSEIGDKLPLMVSDELTENEKNQYLAVFYRSAFTKDMLREVKYMKVNADTVAEQGIPVNTPMYFFISKQQEKSAPGWINELSSYLSLNPSGKYMLLNSGHYIHYDQANVIALETKAFLRDLNKFI